MKNFKSIYLSSYFAFLSLISLIIVIYYSAHKNDGGGVEIGVIFALAYSIGATLIGFIPLLLFFSIHQELLRSQYAGFMSSILSAFLVSVIFVAVAAIFVHNSFHDYHILLLFVLLHSIPVAIIIQVRCK